MKTFIQKYIKVYLIGALMGAVDMVPGVSGGTVALICGIYNRLLNSLDNIPKGLLLLAKLKIKEAWEFVDANFLCALLFGVLTSVFTFAKLLSFLLENHPLLIWSVFFGFILASCIIVYNTITHIDYMMILYFFAGFMVMLLINTMGIQQIPQTTFFIFLSGALASCAMILPGISGSFILVILGIYSFILNAVHQLNISVLLVFVCGIAFGLLTFAKLLKFLLNTQHNKVMSSMLGIMVASIAKVWPWKNTLSYQLTNGKSTPIEQEIVFPSTFERITGQEPQLVACIVLMIIAFAVVLFVEKKLSKN